MAIKSPQPYLILASSSPRRKFLLEQAGFIFDVVPSTIDETKIRTKKPEDHARLLAELKAEQVARDYPHALVIGADTIVVINKIILEKPISTGDARLMLNTLSGRSHDVLTGYAIRRDKTRYCHSAIVRTRVRFKSLTDGEIEWYLDTQEPFDKAGAYAIQGQGAFLVAGINGSYTNVVGLPMCEVIDCLLGMGVAGHLRK